MKMAKEMAIQSCIKDQCRSIKSQYGLDDCRIVYFTYQPLCEEEGVLHLRAVGILKPSDEKVVVKRGIQL